MAVAVQEIKHLQHSPDVYAMLSVMDSFHNDSKSDPGIVSVAV